LTILRTLFGISTNIYQWGTSGVANGNSDNDSVYWG
jgi:hypothetical protein